MTKEEILKNWKNESDVDNLVAIENDTSYIIITDRPGFLIGYKGELVYKYRSLLGNKEIKFVDFYTSSVTYIDNTKEESAEMNRGENENI